MMQKPILACTVAFEATEIPHPVINLLTPFLIVIFFNFISEVSNTAHGGKSASLWPYFN